MEQNPLVRCQFLNTEKKEMHFHQDIEVLYVFAGELYVYTEENEWKLKKDDFLLINSNVRHEYLSRSNILMGSLFINYKYLCEIFQENQMYFLCDSTIEKSNLIEQVRNLIQKIFYSYQVNSGSAFLIRECAAYELVHVLVSDFRVRKGMNQYDSLRGVSDERMNNIMNYLMMHYKEPITLLDMSEKLGLTNTYLSRYLKKTFGMNFLKFLYNIRLEYAVQDMMDSNKTLLRIALDNGFPNLSSFHKVFKESYGVTPTDYRKSLQKQIDHTVFGDNSQEVLEQLDHQLGRKRNQRQSDEVMIVNLTGHTKRDQILKMNWNKMIHIGEAIDLLRYDVREQVRFFKKKLKIQYIGIRNFISDEMMIDIRKVNVQYNFSKMDKVFDFIISQGMHPFIEMEEQETKILSVVSDSTMPEGKISHLLLLTKNRFFMEKLIKHWVARYGIQEVQSWYISVEYRNAKDNQVTLTEYLDAFEAIYEIFKSYLPHIQIGGPGFDRETTGNQLRQVVKVWNQRKIKPDFFNIYSFPYTSNNSMTDIEKNYSSSDEKYLENRIKSTKQVLKEEKFDVKSVIVTFWGFSLSERNILNDSCFHAAYIVNNLLQNWKNTELIAYWRGIDIFSDRVDTEKLLFGGRGLLTKNGICKPAFFAYQFLNELEQYIIAQNENAIITWDGISTYKICCHNQKKLNYMYYMQPENQLQMNMIDKLFDDMTPLRIEVDIEGVPDGEYQIKIREVNEQKGNIQEEWGKLGYYSNLTMPEIEYLQQRSQPELSMKKVTVKNNCLHISTELAGNAIQQITIKEE